MAGTVADEQSSACKDFCQEKLNGFAGLTLDKGLISVLNWFERVDWRNQHRIALGLWWERYG